MVSRGREATAARSRVAWAPRILAPLAFFTAVTVLVLLVHNSLTNGVSESASPTVTREQASTATTGARRGRAETTPVRRERRFYAIRAGDTLEAVAVRFDTTVDDLLRLNPAIDENSLTPGQRIRIR